MLKRGLAVTLALLASLPALAQEIDPSPPPGGGISNSKAAAATPTPALALGSISPSRVIVNAQFGSGGVGLRNRGAGAINVSGVTGPVKGAYLYWATITSGAPTAASKSIGLRRLLPTASTATTLTGTAIGSGAQPCWTGSAITVFKASVPASIANGNGVYQVTLPAGASGLTNGADPWSGTLKLPLMEGASLVIIGTGTADVAVYDTGLAGKTFPGKPGLTYTLALPSPTSSKGTIFQNIGADGQIGSSLAAIGGLSEVTKINNVNVAGAAAPASAVGADNDGDWNGTIAGPLPQLWDNTAHTLSLAAAPAGRTTLAVSIAQSVNASVYDCMTPVANFVALF